MPAAPSFFDKLRGLFRPCGRAGLIRCLTFGICAGLFIQPSCAQQVPSGGADASGVSGFGVQPGTVQLQTPAPEAELPVLPINLPTALQLANTQPIDVQLALERVRGASAALFQARALWLPTVTVGGDYQRHDGEIQDASGAIVTNTHSSLMFGAGSGIGTSAVLSIDDAIFAPLAARQALRARRADVQTATNDSMLAVTDAYFNVQQARGDLAGSQDATRRAEALVSIIRQMAAGLVAPLEVVRAEAELANRREAEVAALERWQTASAELARLLRLDGTAQIVPQEPPQLRIMLIQPSRSVDELVTMGLTYRPELESNQAQVQATLELLKQEKYRPLIPSVLLRGDSTPVTGTLAGGVFAGGTNGDIGNPGGRFDIDLQVLWQFDNLGFGNSARTRARESDHRAAILALFRIQDRIAADVAQAFAEVRQSDRRVKIAESQVRLSLESYNKNLTGLGQLGVAGDVLRTIVRPQEVVAAVQNLALAYTAYYRAIADSNRAQFRLYRALGQPAQRLSQEANAALGAASSVAEPGNSPVPPAPPSTQRESTDAAQGRGIQTSFEPVDQSRDARSTAR
jgi:outer membrane protein TolC